MENSPNLKLLKFPDQVSNQDKFTLLLLEAEMKEEYEMIDELMCVLLNFFYGLDGEFPTLISYDLEKLRGAITTFYDGVE